MISFFKKYWPVVLITLSALAIRVYKLGQFPAGFLWDEAALGYNAYSILKTGKDEYGSLLPLIFKSFGDYKPGLYVYLIIPSILILGLSEFSVRLPSAIFGTLTVLLVYFLLRKESLSSFLKIKSRNNLDYLAVTASFLLAVSPWHINFSRGAWELNIMLFEILLGFFLLTRFLKEKKEKWLYLSGLVFVASLFTYQSAKFLVPVLLFGFLFFFREEFFSAKTKNKRFFFASVFIIYVFFNLITLIGGKAGRIKVMSIFSYPRSPEESGMFLKQDSQNYQRYNFFHNDLLFFSRSILARYFNHFSGKFLFISGDWSNPRNGTIYQGVLYYPDIFFLVLGLAILLGKKRSSLENFMIYWLIAAPIPSALTRDSISSVRSFTMVIPLVFIAATGVSGLIVLLGKFKPAIKYSLSILFFLFFLCYFFFFLRFLDLYFVHDPKFTSEDRLFGYKQAIEYLLAFKPKKEKIIFSNKYGQPYIFYLFYSKYEPREFQKQAKLKENPQGDVGEIDKIDNIYFKKIYFTFDRAESNALIIGDEFDLPTIDITQDDPRFKFIKQINFLNGKTAFRIVETR